MKPDIKSRRKELNLTLEQVGDLVGVGKSTVRKWETGDIENMKRDKIVKLAKALRVSPSYRRRTAPTRNSTSQKDSSRFKNICWLTYL